MRNLLALFFKDLRLLLADRAEILVLVLMPLAFILPIGFALGGGDGYGMSRNNNRMALPVIDRDGGAVSQELVKALQGSLFVETLFTPNQLKSMGLDTDPICAQGSPACQEAAARRMVETSRRAAAVIIPAGLSQSVENGQPAEILFIYDPTADNVHLQQLQGVLNGAALKVSVSRQVNSGMGDLQNLLVFAPESLQQSVAEAEKAKESTPAAEQPPAISLQTIQPSKTNLPAIPDTFQQTVPGYTVMFVFFLIGTISSAMTDERRQGTFRRLLHMPVKKWQIVSGKLFSGVVIGLVQIAILFGVGTLAFRMQIGTQYAALFLLSLALVLCAVSLGLAASTTQIGGVLTPLLIVAALLGGCMFPIDLMPPFLRVISFFVPHSWALQGYQNLMVRGQGLAQTLPHIAILLGFAAIFFFLASRRIDYEEW